jgi:hypothetical protein
LSEPCAPFVVLSVVATETFLKVSLVSLTRLPASSAVTPVPFGVPRASVDFAAGFRISTVTVRRRWRS